MFSEKRKRVIWPYALAIGLILITVLLFIYGTSLSHNEEEDFDIKKPITKENVNASINIKPETSDILKSTEEDEALKKIEKEERCYIIKNDNGIVKIFAVGKDNELKELKDTEIIYDTLSMSDQLTFDEGILVKNKKELNRLMQDFES